MEKAQPGERLDNRLFQPTNYFASSERGEERVCVRGGGASFTRIMCLCVGFCSVQRTLKGLHPSQPFEDVISVAVDGEGTLEFTQTNGDKDRTRPTNLTANPMATNPMTANPMAANPMAANPMTANPMTANPAANPMQGRTQYEHTKRLAPKRITKNSF